MTAVRWSSKGRDAETGVRYVETSPYSGDGWYEVLVGDDWVPVSELVEAYDDEPAGRSVVV